MTRHIFGAILFSIALAACISLGLYAHPTDSAASALHRSTNEPVCDEDESCWNCSTMGNHQCDPVTL